MKDTVLSKHFDATPPDAPGQDEMMKTVYKHGELVWALLAQGDWWPCCIRDVNDARKVGHNKGFFLLPMRSPTSYNGNASRSGCVV